MITWWRRRVSHSVTSWEANLVPPWGHPCVERPRAASTDGYSKEDEKGEAISGVAFKSVTAAYGSPPTPT